MDEFIRQVTGRLPLDAPAARSLAGGLLGLIQQSARTADFARLMQALPGAEQLVPPPAPVYRGRLSRIANELIHTLAGEKPAAAPGLADLFGEARLGTEQGQAFIALFGDFIRSRAGHELADRLLGRLPTLHSIAD